MTDVRKGEGSVMGFEIKGEGSVLGFEIIACTDASMPCSHAIVHHTT